MQVKKGEGAHFQNLQFNLQFSEKRTFVFEFQVSADRLFHENVSSDALAY